MYDVRCEKRAKNSSLTYFPSIHQLPVRVLMFDADVYIFISLFLFLSPHIHFLFLPHFIAFSFHIPFGSKRVKERDPFSFHFLLPLSCFISSLGNLFYSIVSIIYHHFFVFIVIHIFLHMHCRFDQCLSNVGFCICRRYIWEIIIWIRLR